MRSLTGHLRKLGLLILDVRIALMAPVAASAQLRRWYDFDSEPSGESKRTRRRSAETKKCGDRRSLGERGTGSGGSGRNPVQRSYE